MIKLKDLLNEGPQKVGNVNAFGASKVLGKGKKVLGFVADTPNAVATLIQDFPQAMEIEFKQGFFSDGKLLKSIKKGDKVWKELEKRYLDKQTKDAMKAGFNINEKSDDVFADYSSSKGKTKGRSFSVDRVVKDGKYRFESDDNDGTVRLSYNGNPISYGSNDWSTGGIIMIHSSWKNKDKPFLFPEDVIKYFKSKRITTEAVNEAKDLKKYPLDVQKEYNKLLNAFGQAFADRYLERYDEDNEPSEPGLKQQIYDKLKLAKQNTAKEIKQKKFGSDKYPTVLLKHFGIELRKLGKITDAQLNQLINKEGIKTIWQETDFVFKIFNKQKK